MAHTGIFATAAECASKAGENVDATGWVEANINQWCAEIESEVNTMCRYNFSDNYAALDTDVKKLLTSIESCYVAICGIMYNMSGFTTRIEAEDMINILRDTMLRQMKVLKDRKSSTYIQGV